MAQSHVVFGGYISGRLYSVSCAGCLRISTETQKGLCGTFEHLSQLRLSVLLKNDYLEIPLLFIMQIIAGKG
jgi:hypothetical protein